MNKKLVTVISIFVVTLMVMLTMGISHVYGADANTDGYDDNDFNMIQAFLNQPSAVVGKTNGQQINATYNPDDPTTWVGVEWDTSTPKRIVKIGNANWWMNAQLAGSLDLRSLTNLTMFNADGNQLTSLDASGLTNLTVLYCQYNKLTNLNISGLTNLTYFNFDGNLLTSLDVSGLTKLTQLNWCANNQLKSINVSGLTNLTQLNCYNNNQLESIDFSGFTNLTQLNCYNNDQLKSINVSGLTKLTQLNCHDNKQLTSLDASGLTNLTQIDCYKNNQLTSLNVSGLTKLTRLTCFNNQLESIDLSGLTNLTQLDCSYNHNLTRIIGLMDLNAYSMLNCSYNKLTSLECVVDGKILNLTTAGVGYVGVEYGSSDLYVNANCENVSEFTNWASGGSLVSTSSSFNLELSSITSPYTITANFVPALFAVTVNVTDRTNPLRGADVTLGGTTFNTDVNGNCVFTGIARGSYTIKVEKDGYVTQEISTGVASNDITEEVELWPKTPNLWTDNGNYDTALYDVLVANTAGDSINVFTPQQLAAIAKAVNDGVETFSGKTVILTHDINLTGHNWDPIGLSPDGESFSNMFMGNFDGTEHTISNMNILGEYYIAGLFGGALEAVIQNVTVDGTINLAGEVAAVGGIAGIGGRTNFINCNNGVSISVVSTATSPMAGVAGIVGVGMGGDIRDCTNKSNATIYFESLSSVVGGIVGFEFPMVSACTIINSVNHGNVTAKGQTAVAGGIGGYIVGAGVINCYNTGDVATIGGEGQAVTGGIAGLLALPDEADIVVKNCYSIGHLTVADGGMKGGIAAAADIPNPESLSNISYLDTTASCAYYDTEGTGTPPITLDGATKTAIEMKSADYLGELNTWVSENTPINGVALKTWEQQAGVNQGYPYFTSEFMPAADQVATVSTGGGNTQPNVKTEIIVGGDVTNAGNTTTTEVNGKTVTTIVIDQQKLEQKLVTEGNQSTVTLRAKADTDVLIGQLNGQTVKNMENKQAILEIKTDGATYTLPARQINIDAISEQLGTGVALKDIQVRIEIAKASEATALLVENAVKKGEFVIVAPPVEFNVSCTYGDKTVVVSKFINYVERTIALPAGIDAAKITTGVIIDLDGTLRHVPTKIIVIDGKYYAKINSLTNSTYSVVWHPVTFTDVENHWAKEAVNDMGSKMVISGVDNHMFEPDRDITRAEFAAVIVRALGLKPGMGSNPFNDVKASDWYSDYIKTAVEYKIISGYGNGKFGPSDKITREQTMTMIARSMEIIGFKSELRDSDVSSLLANYTDSAVSSDYAKASIAACLKTGIITGRSSYKIAPKNYITRAEVAAIVQRLLQKSNLI